MTPDRAVEDDVPLDDPEAPTGHVDAPLARTLRYEALSRRPTRAQTSRVRQDGVAGRYGSLWRAAVDDASLAPHRVALLVGGMFAGVFAITVIVMVLRGDTESALIGLVVTAAFFIVPGGIAYGRAAVVRRRRWRRHAQAATFAEENGLELLLVASADELPTLVRKHQRARTVVHADLIIGAVRGQTFLAGTRTRERKKKGTVETRHLVWAALWLDPAQHEQLPSQAALEKRLRAHADGGVVRVRYDEWLTVGIEDRSVDLALIEVLFGTLDLALED